MRGGGGNLKPKERKKDSLPLVGRSMDVALVDFRGRSAEAAQASQQPASSRLQCRKFVQLRRFSQEQMALWESKVKPAGATWLRTSHKVPLPSQMSVRMRGLDRSRFFTHVAGDSLTLSNETAKPELAFVFMRVYGVVMAHSYVDGLSELMLQ